MEYKIVKSGSMKGLEIKVNNAIKDGWEPRGGVSSEAESFGIAGFFIQAMVRTSGMWVEEFGTSSGRIKIGTGLELEGAENGV